MKQGETGWKLGNLDPGASGKIENWNPESGIRNRNGNRNRDRDRTGIGTGMERGNYIKIGTTFILI